MRFVYNDATIDISGWYQVYYRMREELANTARDSDHENAIKNYIKYLLRNNSLEYSLKGTLTDIIRESGEIKINEKILKISESEGIYSAEIGEKKYDDLNSDAIATIFSDFLGQDKEFCKGIAAVFNQHCCTYDALNILVSKFLCATTQNPITCIGQRHFWHFTTDKNNKNIVNFHNKFTLHTFKAPEINHNTVYPVSIKCDVKFDFIWNEEEKEISIQNTKLKLEITDRKARYAITSVLLRDKIDFCKKAIGCTSIVFAFGVFGSILTCLNDTGVINLGLLHSDLSVTLFAASTFAICTALAVLGVLASIIHHHKFEYNSVIEECDDIVDQTLKKLSFNQTLDAFQHYLRDNIKKQYIDDNLVTINNAQEPEEGLGCKLREAPKQPDGTLKVDKAKEIIERHFCDKYLNFAPSTSVAKCEKQKIAKTSDQTLQ